MLTETQFRMLKSIKAGNDTQTKLSKDLGYQFNTMYENMNKLLLDDFIKLERSGREVFISLSRKGKRLLNLMEETEKIARRKS